MYAIDLKSQVTPYKEIEEKIELMKKQTQVFVAIKNLDYIVKGGRLPKWVKNIADFLNIRPIMTTKENGKMGAAGIVKGIENFPEKLGKFVLNKLDSNLSYDIAIGHCNILNDGEKLKNIIKNGHDNINSIHLLDMGCALGVHAGPGSLAIAIQSSA